MTRSHSRWVPAFASLVALTASPSVALGQSASERWHGLTPSRLETVYLLDQAGVETSGKLLGLNPDSLVLLVDGVERRFEVAEIARVQKRDSVRNGTVIGAIVGFAMGIVAAGISDCPGDEPGGECAAFRTAAFAMSTGMYAGLGAGVDALMRGRTTLYAAPPRARTPTAFDRPSARAVVRVALSW